MDTGNLAESMAPKNRIEELDEQELADHVEQFEKARADHSDASLEEFLPPSDHPLYLEIASELIRVDLEYGWAARSAKPLRWYRDQWPAVFADPDLLAGIAYEEYRLRCKAGELVSTFDYQKEFDVDVALWPIGLRPMERDEISISSPERQARPTAVGIAEFKPGSRHFGYEIERELGRGASARVFLARQESLANRYVVLKASSMRTSEPDRLARLQHTNVVPLFSYHHMGQVSVMCMPYLGKHTLAEWVLRLKLRKDVPVSTADFVTTFTRRPDPTEHRVPEPEPVGPAPQREVESQKPPRELGKAWENLRDAPYEQTVLWLVSELARGLAHAHDHEILHLDLKPGNVLMTDDGRPMLLDFHLSTFGNSQKGHVEVEGGTLPYMSPEHLAALAGQGSVDRRTDVYSLGVVLFELLTGRLPFPTPVNERPHARRNQETRVKLNRLTTDRKTVPSARKLNSLVSPGADAIAKRCLAPKPEDRYANAHELLEDLERHLQNRPLKHAENPSIAERFTKWRKRHPRVTSVGAVAAMALVLVGLLGAAAVSFSRRAAESDALRCQKDVASQAPELKARSLAASLAVREHSVADWQAIENQVLTLLKLYRADESDSWTEHPLVRALPPQHRTALECDVGQMLFLLAAIRSRDTDDLPDPSVDGTDSPKRTAVEQSLLWSRRASVCLDKQNGRDAARRQQAKLLRRLKRDDEAQAIEAELNLKTSESVGERSWLAIESMMSDDYRRAADLLSEVTRSAPHDLTSWFAAGVCHLKMGQYSDAETSFTVCITMNPRCADFWNQRSVARIWQKSWRGALEDIDKVLELDPQHGFVWFNRALALAGEKNWSEALTALDRAEQQGVSETRIRFKRAELLRNLGDLERAAAEYSLGVRSEPADAEGFAIRGVARANQDPDGAIADFREALRRDPRCFDAARNLANVLDGKKRDRPAAIAALDAMLAQTNRDPLAYSGRAVLHAHLGNAEQARRDAAAALKISRGPWVVYQVACVEAILAGDRREVALPLIRESFSADPSIAAIAAQDPDLGPLVDDPRFKELVSAAAKLSTGR